MTKQGFVKQQYPNLIETEIKALSKFVVKKDNKMYFLENTERTVGSSKVDLDQALDSLRLKRKEDKIIFS